MVQDQRTVNDNFVHSTRLFIGGLPYRYTEGELLTLFAPYGRIISLKIMHTQWGKSRGIGYIEFDNSESAKKAKTALHNYHIDDSRTIIVDFAKPDPLNTPEGQLRHEQAVQAKQQRFARFNRKTGSDIDNNNRPQIRSIQTDNPRSSFKKVIKPVFGSTRQSVYDSRTHHSRVGAKFAKRNKK